MEKEKDKTDFLEWVGFLNKYDIGFKVISTRSSGEPGMSLEIEARESKNVGGYRGFVFSVFFNEDQRFDGIAVWE